MLNGEVSITKRVSLDFWLIYYQHQLPVQYLFLHKSKAELKNFKFSPDLKISIISFSTVIPPNRKHSKTLKGHLLSGDFTGLNSICSHLLAHVREKQMFNI